MSLPPTFGAVDGVLDAFAPGCCGDGPGVSSSVVADVLTGRPAVCCSVSADVLTVGAGVWVRVLPDDEPPPPPAPPPAAVRVESSRVVFGAVVVSASVVFGTVVFGTVVFGSAVFGTVVVASGSVLDPAPALPGGCCASVDPVCSAPRIRSAASSIVFGAGLSNSASKVRALPHGPGIIRAIVSPTKVEMFPTFWVTAMAVSMLAMPSFTAALTWALAAQRAVSARFRCARAPPGYLLSRSPAAANNSLRMSLYCVGDGRFIIVWTIRPRP